LGSTVICTVGNTLSPMAAGQTNRRWRYNGYSKRRRRQALRQTCNARR
jgi:hypothetical protein